MWLLRHVIKSRRITIWNRVCMGDAFSVPFILSCLQFILHLISGWVCQSSPCVYSSNVLPETLGDGGLFIVWYIFNIILNLKIEKVICIFLMIAPSSFPHVIVYRVAWIYSSPVHLCFDELCLTSAFLTNEWLNVTCTVKEEIFPFEGFPRDKLVSSIQ